MVPEEFYRVLIDIFLSIEKHSGKTSGQGVLNRWKSKQTSFLGVAVIAVVAMLVIPIPTVLLDMLLGISIMMALIILLTTMYSTKSSDFSVFPSLLLITTVYRLALNVSSTRLILLEGPGFDGQLIRSFGEFVVGGNYIIGFIIFLILIFRPDDGDHQRRYKDQRGGGPLHPGRSAR